MLPNTLKTDRTKEAITMLYRTDKHGNKLSQLGYGCMRFTRKGGGVDVDKAEKELMAAYNAGVNYFDTAYIYPGSEAAVGEIFARNKIRDKVNIVLGIIFHELLPERKESLARAVLEYLAVDMAQGIYSLLRGRKVWLSYVQMIHFDTSGLCIISQRSKLTYWR